MTRRLLTRYPGGCFVEALLLGTLEIQLRHVAVQPKDHGHVARTESPAEDNGHSSRRSDMHIYIDIHIYIYACVYIHIYIYIRIHISTCANVLVYKYIEIRLHTYSLYICTNIDT